MSAAATRAGSFVSGSDKASVAPRLTRRDTIPEHEAKIEEHFQCEGVHCWVCVA